MNDRVAPVFSVIIPADNEAEGSSSGYIGHLFIVSEAKSIGTPQDANENN